ncbi:hypothetical protein ACWC1D_35680, partial [Streptomyces sp. NPDC001478]
MSYATRPRAALRLRAATLMTLPVLALAAACGDDSGAGNEKNPPIADVPSAGPSSGTPEAPEGTVTPRPTAKSAYYDAQLSYVRCMRTKGGYKDYPDPKLSGYLDWVKIEKVVDPGNRVLRPYGYLGVLVVVLGGLAYLGDGYGV